MSVDVSILIVHTHEARMIRQTLRGIRRAAPQLAWEVIIVDNNPDAGLYATLRREFPQARYVPLDGNRGFGHAMNAGMKESRGKYTLVFNPDIIVRPGSLEALFTYMEANSDVGIIGPKLQNPDGSLQHSCYRFHEILTPVFRRTPLGRLPSGKAAVARYLMLDFDHSLEQDVDWLIGAALFARTSMLAEVGGFDDRFFLYLEDTDLCRRFWEKGYRVVYQPKVSMIHYHRRASNDGGLLTQVFRSRSTREHIKSWAKYFWKHRGKPHPRAFTGFSSTEFGAAQRP